MMMQFGETELPDGDGLLSSRLRLTEGPLDLSWHHCATTSDFLGSFFAGRASTNNFDSIDARHSISYLVNELLENAVKFRAPGDIFLESGLLGDKFRVRVSNLVAEDTAKRFQDLLKELTARDPGELLIERIEENAMDPDSKASGLGLLTLMNDYGARLGWRFKRDDASGPVSLETFASLSLA